MKKCCKCSIEKPLTEFSKNKKSPDGLQWQCKVCKKGEFKQWYENNKPQHRNYVVKWKSKKSGIYEWYEGNTCLYVGQSAWLNSRISSHKCYYKNISSAPKHNRPLYEYLQQHQNAQIRIIEECIPEVLLEREQYYIDTKKPLYNKNNI
jgi:excinuclease UvrABC nuclease subunit